MMHDMGDGWHWGFGFGHGFFGILFWFVVILAIAAMLKYLIGKKDD